MLRSNLLVALTDLHSPVVIVTSALAGEGKTATSTSLALSLVQRRPGEVLPAGDLLGDMLMEAGHAEEALAAFEAVLTTSPNRLYSLFGAGYAAERAGRLAQARNHYEQLVKVAAAADPGVKRLDHARSFLTGYASATVE